MKQITIGLVLIFLVSAFAEAAFSHAKTQQQAKAEPKTQLELPTRTLDFKIVQSDPGVSISPVTTIPPHCTSDGYLFVDMLDTKDMNKHIVVAIRGKSSLSFSPSLITDIHDIHVYSFFPSDSVVGFLIRGTKALPGAPGPGKSAARVEWRDYHNYVAEFDRNGAYLKSVELPMTYLLSHFAILPSGEFLVSGYDQLNSTARLLLLDSSGEVLRVLDLPAARTAVGQSDSYGSIDEAKATRNLIGSVVFSAYNQDILVWRMGSRDPILDVGPGGRVREVPLEVPDGAVFVDMIPANDRWVAHFRSQQAVENATLNESNFFYEEVRPQDGTLSSKLVQGGDIPMSIACEINGKYLAFRRDDKDGKLVLLNAE